MRIKLSELKMGESGRVVSLTGISVDIHKKLMAMGLLPNTTVTLVRSAPLGDPLQLKVREVNIAMRKKMAESIEVEK